MNANSKMQSQHFQIHFNFIYLLIQRPKCFENNFFRPNAYLFVMEIFKERWFLFESLSVWLSGGFS